MHWKHVFRASAALVLVLAGSACAAAPERTSQLTPEPTARPGTTVTSRPEPVSVQGVSCPEAFEDDSAISRELQVAANAVLTLTLGSTPSMPCSWQPPEIEDDTILRQVEHRSEWPAEGATPQPGAPGTEIWVFETLKEGRGKVSLACKCLGEEGGEEETAGVFVLDINVQ